MTHGSGGVPCAIPVQFTSRPCSYIHVLPLAQSQCLCYCWCFSPRQGYRLTASALAKKLLALGRQGLHQGVIGIDKLLYALVLELPGEAMEVNASALEFPQNAVCLFHVCLNRIGGHPPVVCKGGIRISRLQQVEQRLTLLGVKRRPSPKEGHVWQSHLARPISCQAHADM